MSLALKNMRRKSKMKTQQIQNKYGSRNAALLRQGVSRINYTKPPAPNGVPCVAVPGESRSLEIRQERRGRKAAAAPSQKHLDILNATRTQTYQQVGAQYGCSRQRVGQIVRRWKAYVPIRPLPTCKTVASRPVEQGRPAREVKACVISFRVTATEIQLLRQRYSDQKSVNRAARSIVTKVLSI
jgi:hypothetical protein